MIARSPKRNLDLIFRVGGEGGEGVISTGELLTLALARSGYEIYTFRTYPPEIKGGHAVYQVRVSDQVILSQGDLADVLVAFNQEAYDRHIKNLKQNGVLVYDGESFEPPQGPHTSYNVPLGRIASEEVGFRLSKNIVSLGVLSELFEIPLVKFRELLEERFQKKGTEVLNKNLKALMAGSDFVRKNIKKTHSFKVGFTTQHEKLVMSGNEYLALGALVAGVKLYAGYPITPATDIMEWLARELPKVGGVVLQMEDEMAALGAVLGASIVGKKAMTATSGPGFSLMAEMIGLATAAEVPVVVVDVQRAGPSTGMPTKTEQGDLDMSIWGGHGESPRIVIGLTSVGDCFNGIIRAFNFAEKFQSPVIVLSDQYLGHRKATITKPDLAAVLLENRIRPTGEDLVNYKRYKVTESGISPMAVPGETEGVYFTATGLEHDEASEIIHEPEVHRKMVAKRARKIRGTLDYPDLVRRYGVEKPEIAVVGWGSLEGVIREAIMMANDAGIPVAALHPKLLNPLPVQALQSVLGSVRKVIVPELNYSGQFAYWLAGNIPNLDIVRLNKCEGIPFAPKEIYDCIAEVANHG